MKTKKVIKKIKKHLNKHHFIKQDYKMTDSALELKTYYYKKNDYDVYVHRYNNSVRFVIENKINNEKALFEVWKEKCKIERYYKQSGLNDFFDDVYNETMKVVNAT
jgi:hypothetical protein